MQSISRRSHTNQQGFAIIGIVALVLLVIGVAGLALWRVQDAKQAQERANKQQLISGPLVPEDQLALESQQKENLSSGAAGSSTQASTGSSGSTTKPASNNGGSTPASSTSNTGTGSSAAPSTAATSAGSGENKSSSTAAPASSITRPSADFCKQQDGNSFTNVWLTDNRQHTYQVYENGAAVTKTGTGTAALNYDTMQTVSVLPYLTQPAWTTCSDKSGYLMVYYKPSGSVYTYNWLVPFEHASVTKP